MISSEKKLVLGFIDFLKDQINENESSPDCVESLEVAIQCLETAFNVTSNESSEYIQNGNKKLINIYKESATTSKSKDIDPEIKKRADDFKNRGNDLMKTDDAKEALNYYNKALELDNTDPIYYCNRAASYMKLNEIQNAIKDCNKALSLNPLYSKAYGRLGMAYVANDQIHDAVKCYNKALELEPNNESYINNLKICQEKIKEMNLNGGNANGGDGNNANNNNAGGAEGPPGFGNIFSAFGLGGQGPGSAPSAGGVDFATMLNNPTLINMASNLMSNPQIQSALSGMLNTAAAPGAETNSNFDAFLNIGQQLASQIQNQNPELINQLRNQFTGTRGGSAPPATNPAPPTGPPNDGNRTAKGDEDDKKDN